jgi:hypothetical protein
MHKSNKGYARGCNEAISSARIFTENERWNLTIKSGGGITSRRLCGCIVCITLRF